MMKVMDLFIESLYKNKKILVREVTTSGSVDKVTT